MLFVLVFMLAGVIGSQGGYIRQSLPLGIPHPLLIQRDFLQTQLLPRGVIYAVRDTPEKDVSYTLSYEDYLYLKRHKIEGQDSPFDPDPEPIPTGDIKEHKHDHIKQDVPRSNAGFKRSVGTNSHNGCNKVFISAPAPKVHKHVYFHVPPPDFEEPQLTKHVIQPAPKKNINILFIKAPSYNSNRAHLQQLLLNQQAPIEDKTLIYVLSKKEDLLLPQPVVLPSKPSAPEVYFVKYKTNGIGSINNELSFPSILQNASPVLERKRETHDP